MGNGGNRRAWVRSVTGGLPLLVLLAGCAHRDPVDTPVAWWHQLEGGAIAQQRPPPPGVDDPYPKIGTTPAAAPKVASAELRHSVTQQLIEQRNLSVRLNAHDPLPPPAAVPAKAAKPAPPAVLNPAQSSATLDAADAPPPPPAPPAPAGGTAIVPAAAGGGDPADLALPTVVPTTDSVGPIVLPAIPEAPPPPPPGLPGIVMPPPPSYVPPARPNYALAQGPGELLQFAAGSDVLGSGQSGALHQIATHRGTGSIFVHGYGEASSDSPQDQAQALTLGALRARSVADALEKEGVPASAIRIRADAFGRGARAGLVD